MLSAPSREVGEIVSTLRLRRRVPLARWAAPVARSPEAGPRAAGSGDAGSPASGSPTVASVRRRVLQWPHLFWVDIAWVGFVALNLAAMRLLPAWQTVPFLAIWVSLTVIYGFRLWRLQPTILTLAAVTL